jgi:hypothetical protein
MGPFLPVYAAKPMNAEARRRASEVGERGTISTPGSSAGGGLLAPRRSTSTSGDAKGASSLIWSTAATSKVSIKATIF